MAAAENLDKDPLGRGVGPRSGSAYEAQGERARQDRRQPQHARASSALRLHACRVGRYPSPVSPGKLVAYHYSVRMFSKASRYFDPPLEIVEILFEGKKLVGYLQKPPGVEKPAGGDAHWGGVDGWKEDRLRIASEIMKAGLVPFTIDMPGSGENQCCYGDPLAEKTLLRLARLSRFRRGAHRRPLRRSVGRQLRRLLGGAARLHRSRPHQGRGVPRRQRALRLPEGVADPGLHHWRRNLPVRRAQPA